MANRNWSNGGKIYTMHVSPVISNVSITIGGTGAVSSFTGSTVQSVSRAGTGLYDITFQSLTNFNAYIFGAGSMQSPSSGLSNVLAIEVQNAPTTAVQTSTGATIRIKTLDAAGALVDPASGSVVNFFMMCNNSSVKS